MICCNIFMILLYWILTRCKIQIVSGKYHITGNFCGYLISAVFGGQLRIAEIQIAEYYVKFVSNQHKSST